MGRVYLARSAGGRTVAVKVVRAELAEDAEFRARFRREVSAAQSVDGAYTAPVVDADRDSDSPWLATAYVLGPSLTEAVAAHGPLPEDTVRALGAVLADALAAIHRAGLVHRDLKPSNVLLAADGPRVIDFGIARALDGAGLTSTGVLVGSPGFMSPEQASGGHVGAPGDVFALGSVLVFAATGHGPFGQESAAALLYRVVHDTPDLDGLPQTLRPAVEACLAKDPASRPTPAELSALLAPEGTAELLRQGWLPAAVASGIARHAAQVMELETPAPRSGTQVGLPAADPRGSDARIAGGQSATDPRATDPRATDPRATDPRTSDSRAGDDPRAAVGFGAAPAYPGEGEGPDEGTVRLSQAASPSAGPGTGGPDATSPRASAFGAGPSVGPAAPVPPAPAPAAGPRSRRGLLIGSLAVVGVAAVGGGTAAALSGGGHKKPTPAPSPHPTGSGSGSASASASPSASPQPTRAPGVPPQPVWSYTADAALDVPPVVADGKVLVCGDTLVALDARSGKQAWSGPGLQSSSGQPPIGLGAGVIVMESAEADDAILGLDPATGAQRWTMPEPKDLGFNEVLAVDDHAAYIVGSKYPLDSKGQPDIPMDGTSDKAMIAVSLDTRKVLWTQPRNASANDIVEGLVSGGYLVYTNDLGNVVVRDTKTGAQLWSKDFGNQEFPASEVPLVVDGTIYLSGKTLYGFDLAKGTQRLALKVTNGGAYECIAMAGGVLYAVDARADMVVALNPTTGKRTWECPVVPNLSGAPIVVIGQTVFFASDTANCVYAIDRGNGRLLWKFQDGLDSSDSWWLATDGTTLYATHSHRVYALPSR